MTIKRVANSKCRSCVEDRTEFDGNNLYGRVLQNKVYVVYSYGEHFPLFVFTDGRWHENDDGYSRSTARHTTQARPRWADDRVLMDTGEMKALINRATART